MENKELWRKAEMAIGGELLTLDMKISGTVRKSLIGLEFILARYKFVAKMLQNREHLKVLDLGCGEGLGDLLIAQNCGCDKIVGIDFMEDDIKWANENIANEKMEFLHKDFMGEDIFSGRGDCVVSLDVVEHIPVEQEDEYLKTICLNLAPDGIAVIGTPNVTMHPYASPWNKEAHINNYSQERLYAALSKYFKNVFIFGMNDEVLHTGFYPMSCYIMALCCGKRNKKEA